MTLPDDPGGVAAVARFIRARLDEEEAGAPSKHFAIYESEYHSCPASLTEPLGDLPFGENACDCRLAERRAQALARVAAGRRAVRYAEACVAVYEGLGDPVSRGMVTASGIMLRAFASTWVAHRDYQPAWDSDVEALPSPPATPTAEEVEEVARWLAAKSQNARYSGDLWRQLLGAPVNIGHAYQSAVKAGQPMPPAEHEALSRARTLLVADAQRRITGSG